jgi:hypothetical protein
LGLMQHERRKFSSRASPARGPYVILAAWYRSVSGWPC